VFVCDKCSFGDKTAEITVVPMSSSASVASAKYGCKNSTLPLVSWFYIGRGSYVVARVAFYFGGKTRRKETTRKTKA
jgi:hypothetical protein